MDDNSFTSSPKKMKGLSFLLILSVVIFSFALLGEAASVQQLVEINVQTDNRIELVFHTGEWLIEDERVTIPTMQLNKNKQPMHTILLGVSTDVAWRIVSAEFVTIQLSQISDGDTDLITVSQIGMLRDQPVAQLTFHPVQQSRSMTRIYTEVVVELTGEFDQLTYQPNHPAYEQLLATTLLNYPMLNRPDAATAVKPIPVPRDVLTPSVSLRVPISQTGLYRLPLVDLAAAGLAIDDPTQLRLTNRTNSVATLIEGDALIFFGEMYEDLYTTENIYWVTNGQGAAMGLLTQNHPMADVASQFITTAHFEQNTVYWNTMPDGTGQDHWFWGERISPNTSGLETTRTITAHLPVVAATSTITLHVVLKGYTTLAHNSRVSLNGTLVDEQMWQGQSIFTHTIPVTGSLLVAGDNMVTIESADAGAIVDQLYINSVSIDYAASYTAIDNTLFFKPPASGTYAFTASGFTTDAIYLFDVTNQYSPQSVSYTINDDTLHFQQVVTSGTRFFATTIVTIPSNSPNNISNWRNAGHSADWLIITHADFITPAQRLADHRAAQGMQTAVVDIQDVYDEFSDGFFTPAAIRDFLAYTHASWQSPAPTYVVLLGDGSQDYKDQLGSGASNFIPPKMIETFDYGQIPSDHWYVTFGEDDLFAEMFIGRLSAETLTHADAIVDNIIAYENRPAPIKQRAVFIADDKDTVFETNSEQLIDYLPDAFDAERIYVGTYTTATVTRDITQTLQSGATFVNYAGHGNYYRWGSYRVAGHTQRIFTEAHADVLTNSEKYPFVTVANCLNGFFSIPSNLIVDPYNEALAEALQRQFNGGAVAVWADAGFGYLTEQRILLNAFYRILFDEKITTLGAATNIAKVDLYTSSPFWQQNVRTMTLFGDPATSLKTNESIPLNIETTTHSITTSVTRSTQLIIILSTIILSVVLLAYKNLRGTHLPA